MEYNKEILQETVIETLKKVKPKKVSKKTLKTKEEDFGLNAHPLIKEHDIEVNNNNKSSINQGKIEELSKKIIDNVKPLNKLVILLNKLDRPNFVKCKDGNRAIPSRGRIKVKRDLVIFPLPKNIQLIELI